MFTVKRPSRQIRELHESTVNWPSFLQAVKLLRDVWYSRTVCSPKTYRSQVFVFSIGPWTVLTTINTAERISEAPRRTQRHWAARVGYWTLIWSRTAQREGGWPLSTCRFSHGYAWVTRNERAGLISTQQLIAIQAEVKIGGDKANWTKFISWGEHSNCSPSAKKGQVTKMVRVILQPRKHGATVLLWLIEVHFPLCHFRNPLVTLARTPHGLRSWQESNVMFSPVHPAKHIFLPKYGILN